MKKIKVIMLGLLLTSFAALSLSAETWDQYLNRVNIMSDAVIQAMANPAFRIQDSNDRIGAVWATHEWCFWAYVNIRDNYPNLPQQEKNKYALFAEIHRVEVNKLEEIIYRFSTSTFNNIVDRYNYWIDHLKNGGTITFR